MFIWKNVSQRYSVDFKNATRVSRRKEKKNQERKQWNGNFLISSKISQCRHTESRIHHDEMNCRQLARNVKWTRATHGAVWTHRLTFSSSLCFYSNQISSLRGPIDWGGNWGPRGLNDCAQHLRARHWPRTGMGPRCLARPSLPGPV